MFFFVGILARSVKLVGVPEVSLANSAHPRYIPAQPVNQQLVIVLLLRLRVALGVYNRLDRASVIHSEPHQTTDLNQHAIGDGLLFMVDDCLSVGYLCAPIVNLLECLVV